MIIQPPQQRSYLLRLWQTSGQCNVKISLIDVYDSKHKLHFTTLEDLYSYLKESVVSDLDKAVNTHNKL